MADSSIEWTDKVWNPVRGCARVSPGCTHCYAEVMAARFSDPGMWGHGFAERTEHGARWTRKVSPVPEKLAEPLHWRKPVRVFVNSTSDLFHEDVPDEYIAAVFGVMAACPQHTFQCLTKRAERMARWFEWAATQASPAGEIAEGLWHVGIESLPRVIRGRWTDDLGVPVRAETPWPLPNVWIGVSVEDQQRADERIPHLLRCPAAVRFLSCEPLLGPVDLGAWMGDWDCHACHARFWGPGEGDEYGLVEVDDEFPDGTQKDEDDHGRHVCPRCGQMDFGTGDVGPRNEGQDEYDERHDRGGPLSWVIVGGESGAGARPFDLAWARSLVAQCAAASVPVFLKQLGRQTIETDGQEHPTCGQCRNRVLHAHRRFVPLKSPKGGDPAEWPADLRVREFPEPRRTP